MIVFRIPVQDHSSDRLARIVGVRPYLGDVKDIPLVVLSISSRHDLGLPNPSDLLSTLDRLKEVSLSKVRVFVSHLI